MRDNPANAPCPRCGADAQTTPLGFDKVSVVCTECGAYEIDQAEFDVLETDLAE